MAYHWRKPLPFNITCILASDSRFRSIEHRPPPNQHIYSTINIIERGARVCNLEEPILDELSNILPSDVVVVYINAGINNLTFKEHHAGGIDIVPHTRQNVVEEMLNLKQSIRQHFARSLVGISTIPIISFKNTQAHNTEFNHLQSKYDDTALDAMQKNLSYTLAEVNTLFF